MDFPLYQNCTGGRTPHLFQLMLVLTGCGGLVFGEYFHVKFPDFILFPDLPIPTLELLTITVAIKTWAKKLQGLRRIVHCDNDASVHALNHKRSHNKFIQHCLRELLLYLSLYNISLHAKQEQLTHLQIT